MKNKLIISHMHDVSGQSIEVGQFVYWVKNDAFFNFVLMLWCMRFFMLF